MRIALIGQPVSTRNLSAVALPKRYALPLFGADGISSVAYAADQMILTLAAAGASALAFSPWIGLGVAMVGLLVIGTYRYNINQIASEGDIQLVHRKLGALPSIVMGASSLMDYMLTVAVSMSSASSFLVALYPQIQDWRTLIAVLLIVALTLFALRGVQLLGKIAYWPLYVFLALLGVTLIVGWVRAATGTLPLAESATYVIAPELETHSLEGLALVLLLARSFSAGLVAFSGVSTISNSVKYFRRPKKYNAAVTMMLMGLITSVLLVSLLGFAAATRVHMVHDTTRFLFIDGHTPGEYFHQKPALYQVALAIYQGVPFFAQLLVFATVGVLIIASLTAFTGFPVIASSLADYQYLPVFFRSVDSRGLYANGVLALSAFSIFLTCIFGSDVYSLIQLYIVGMCLSMMLVQLAVVRYRMRLLRITLAQMPRRALLRDIAVSTVGVVVTTAVLVTIVVTKFAAGAWLSLGMIALMVGGMVVTRRHYDAVDAALDIPLNAESVADVAALPSRVHAIVYVERVRRPAVRALSYARAGRPSTIEALTVNNDRAALDVVKKRWYALGIPVPLSVIDSPYRDTVEAVVSYIRRRRKKSPRDILVVYLPEFVVEHWWQRILHRRTVRRLKQALLHEPGVMTATVPWAMHEDEVYDEIFDQRLQGKDSATNDPIAEADIDGSAAAIAPKITRSAGGGRELIQSNRHAVYRGRLHEADAVAREKKRQP
ncbi:APC family permease [Rothia sp. (in: high G+C Gram-positive bacteria)]|uniref:APC family permease n=1 Tax=unclassified Rothia (in: high G+C Gram-positive bacteria) TaxID=2689056 RepID=UPI001CAFBACA|nr:APC family permease [Rothia sp. (in: high G+C Gram-positive bacteria)]MBF1668927.1 amino acid permease [Rothia sp. (in: high G+C Gram-positive bacteria)]